VSKTPTDHTNANTIATDKILFARIAEGDEAAFETIFHSYTRTLHPYILSLIKSETDAKEVIQEIFLKLWIKREALVNVDNPGGYLYMMVANEVYDHFRREARYVKRLHLLATEAAATEGGAPATMAGDWTGASPNLGDIHEAFDTKEMKGLIREAVERLPLRRRQIFQMIRLEGYTRRETAEALGISENTVRNQLTDAVAFVQDYIVKNKSLYLPAFLIALVGGIH
jgi:RNA polymerase sigma-70 factor (family 1)